MDKYTVMIRGHKTVLAKDEQAALSFVEEALENIHDSFNLKVYKEL